MSKCYSPNWVMPNKGCKNVSSFLNIIILFYNNVCYYNMHNDYYMSDSDA